MIDFRHRPFGAAGCSIVVAGLVVIAGLAHGAAPALDDIVLLAHAADARAAVFKLPSGEKRRLTIGETLADTGLRLTQVDAGGVELRADQLLHGQAYAMPLRDGEHLSPRKVADIREALQAMPVHPLSPNPVALPAGKGKPR